MGANFRLALVLLTVVALSPCQAAPGCVQKGIAVCLSGLSDTMKTITTGVMTKSVIDEIKNNNCGDKKYKLKTALYCIAEVENTCDKMKLFSNQALMNFVDTVCQPDSVIDSDCIANAKSDIDNCDPGTKFDPNDCTTIPNQMLCAIKALKVKNCNCLSTQLIVNLLADTFMDNPAYKKIEANCSTHITRRRELVKCEKDSPKDFALVNNVLPWLDCNDDTSVKETTKNCLRGTDLGDEYVRTQSFVTMVPKITDTYCDGNTKDLVDKIHCVNRMEDFCMPGFTSNSTEIMVNDVCKNKKDINSKCMAKYEDKIKGCGNNINPTDCKATKAHLKCSQDKLRECNCISSKIMVDYAFNSIKNDHIMKTLEKDCIATWKSQVDAVVCDAKDLKKFNQANGLGLSLPSLVMSLLLAALFTWN